MLNRIEEHRKQINHSDKATTDSNNKLTYFICSDSFHTLADDKTDEQNVLDNVWHKIHRFLTPESISW